MDRKILWKFNIVDLMLIAVILIGAIALIYNLVSGSGSEEEPFLFTYICRSAPNEAFDGIDKGVMCMDGDYGSSLGKLTNADISEIKDDEYNKQAVFVSALSGVKTEHGVTVGDVLYLKGKELNLVVGDSVFSVYLSDMANIE